MVSLPSGNSIPSAATTFPLLTTSLAHLVKKKSNPIVVLKIRKVWTKDSSLFSEFVYKFKSTM